MTDVLPPSSILPSRGESILTAFTGFRGQLDAHTDKRERIIKLSRDITALSKKLIFTLHRLSLTATPPPGDRYKEAKDKDNEIRVLLAKVGSEFGEEDEGEFWRYEGNITGGVQEYIEGVSFLYFLETNGGLIPLNTIQSSLSHPETGKVFFPVTPSDYILGLSDLTGELMRYTLNAIALGHHDIALKTVEFVRTMKAQFDPLISLVPGLYKKQEITAQSLQKIENAAYQVALRRQEFKGREDLLGEMVKRGLAAAANEGGDDEGSRGGKRARME
ncbi:Translin [Mrakia frigida]|uniref:translin family protein n=1 Tax=Mrakia frigida TaxID=29902 RepID=UPI003FCC127D